MEKRFCCKTENSAYSAECCSQSTRGFRKFCQRESHLDNFFLVDEGREDRNITPKWAIIGLHCSDWRIKG